MCIRDRDLSTATGIFYRQALRCHGLPFEVKVDEPNAVTYAAMEAAEKGYLLRLMMNFVQ